MKLQLTKIDPILNAFIELDGYVEVLSVGAERKPVSIAFVFGALFSWLKVENITELRAQSAKIKAMRQSIAKEFALPGQNMITGEKAVAFNQKFDEAAAQEIEINLKPFKKADLNLYDPKDNPTGNMIPATTLVALLPLISDA